MIILLWTIRIALGFYLLAAAVLMHRGNAAHADRRLARWAWTLAFVFYLAHVASAFHFVHDWSHAKAYEHTASRTDQVIGWNWGGGLFINYLFTLVWLLDVAWWWRDPAAYLARPRWVTYMLHTFFAFIIVNATVIFGKGTIRWAGAAATIGLLTWWLAWRRG